LGFAIARRLKSKIENSSECQPDKRAGTAC